MLPSLASAPARFLLAPSTMTGRAGPPTIAGSAGRNMPSMVSPFQPAHGSDGAVRLPRGGRIKAMAAADGGVGTSQSAKAFSQNAPHDDEPDALYAPNLDVLYTQEDLLKPESAQSENALTS